MTNLFTESDNVIITSIDLEIKNRYGIKAHRLHSTARDNELSHARFIVWWILRNKHKWSLKKIAHAYDRDHTTVCDGLKRATKIGLNSEADQVASEMTYPHIHTPSSSNSN